MKVALVFPRFKYPSGDPPLGILYIASYLEKNADCEIDLLDTTFNPSFKYVQSFFHEKSYDIIAISSMTSMINDAMEVARIGKISCPDSIVVLGGPHPTIEPSETLKNLNVDAVCIGEGEKTIAEIVQKNGDFNGVKGIWFKNNGEVIKNSPREPINNLDDLPFPDLELSSIENYMKNWFQLDAVSSKLKGTNIITSRGCPYSCTYCQPTLRNIFGKKVRKRSPPNIVEELLFLNEKYAINSVMFQDDTFVFDEKWIFDICDGIVESGVDLTWGCNVRANLVSHELMQAMKDAGLRKVNMGIESGSQRILDEIYNKQIKLSHVEKSVKILNDLDIKVQGYFMLGAPTETINEINQTIKFANKLNIDEATFSITTPLPHTYLYDKTKQWIATDITEFDYYKKSVYDGLGIPPKKLNYLKKEALLRFYLSPKRLIQTSKQFNPSNIQKTFMKLKRF